MQRKVNSIGSYFSSLPFKPLISKAALLALFLALSTASFASLDEKVDRRFEIDVVVVSEEGCEYHITGWIDVSFIPPSVNGYDITMEGPCGDHHFTGSADVPHPDDNNDGTLSESEKKAFAKSLLDQEEV